MRTINLRFWKIIAAAIMLASSAILADEQMTPYAGVPGWEESREERMDWWREARLGLFINMGLYSVAGGYWPPDPETGTRYLQDYSEWIQYWAGVTPRDLYNKTIDGFTAKNFDPAALAELARRAGMGYAVFDTKHHDGFTLFNSQADYSIQNEVAGTTNISPEGRDLTAEFTEAFRAAGFKVGLYYSLFDWQHPDGPEISLPNYPREPRERQYSNYVHYLHEHIEELLTNYGDIDILWVDYSTAQFQGAFWRTTELLTRIRELQPQILVNNRFWDGLENRNGDFLTPEKYVPATGWPSVDWEVNHTMNESYGFSFHDQNWKSVDETIQLMIDIVSKGGNLLLNVGPDGTGAIPHAAIKILKGLADWMDVNAESIHGTGASPFELLPWGRATRKDDTIYLHVFDWPANGRLRVPLLNDISSARLLGGGELAFGETKDGVWLHLPEKPIHSASSVIALQIQGEPEVPQKQCVIHYSFDNPNDLFTSGRQIIDNSGNGLHGTVASTISTVSEGISGRAIATGGNPHFNVPLPQGAVAANNMTLNFWLRSADLDAWEDWGRLTFSDGTTANLAELRTSNAANNHGFYWRDVNATNTSTINTNVNVKDNQWHMVTVVIDPPVGGTGSSITLYTNGANPTQTPVNPVRDKSFSLTNLQIGRGESAGPTGLLDEVQLYNTALSASDVALLFNNPGLSGHSFRQWDSSTTTTDWAVADNWVGIGPESFPGAIGTDSSRNAEVAIIRGSSAAAIGIDMHAAAGHLALGAIIVEHSSDLSIGNSSTQSSGSLRLNGATVGGVADTVLSLGGSHDLNLAHILPGADAQPLELVLGTRKSVFHVEQGRTLTMSTNLSEIYPETSITVRGGGRIILNGESNISGNINLMDGVMELRHARALQNSALELAGQKMLFTAPEVSTYIVAGISGSAALDLGAHSLKVGGNDADSSYTGDMKAAGLIKTGTGRLTLTGNNNFDSITVTGGSIAVDSVSALGDAMLTLAGGGIELQRNIPLDSEIILVGPAHDNFIGGSTIPEVEYLAVGGGGAADTGLSGQSYGAGGGGGGVVTGTVSDVSGTSHIVQVGAGGLPGAPGEATAGGHSRVFGATAEGGMAGSTSGLAVGGTSGSGHIGGSKVGADSGGGGGAGGPGLSPSSPRKGGDGGPGVASDINGSESWYGGGGAGGISYPAGTNGGPSFGGSGGGGAYDQAGEPNTGGGGGSLRAGGSGVVVVRYRGEPIAEGGAVSTGTGSAKGYTLHTFTEVGEHPLRFKGLPLGGVVAGAIDGPGGLTVAIDGTLTLTAKNSYAGQTIVASGCLLVAGEIGSSEGVTVEPGASIGGGGRINGSLHIASGAQLHFNPREHLTVSGTLSFEDFSIYDLQGLCADTEPGTYTIIDGQIEHSNLSNYGPEFAVRLHPSQSGRYAYFDGDGLTLVVSDSRPAASPVFDLSSRLDQGAVALNWSATSKPNTDRYIVERLINGRWLSISEDAVPAAAELGEANYTIVDADADAKEPHWYRVAEITADGSRVIRGPFRLPPLDSLMVHYTFNNATDFSSTGSFIADASGNRHHGVEGNPLRWAPGGIDGGSIATNSEPNGPYFTRSFDAGLIEGNDFTLSFWVKTSAGTTGDWARIDFTQGGATHSARLHALNGIAFSDPSNSLLIINDLVNCHDGEWHMVTVVSDPKSRKLHIYVNGSNPIAAHSKRSNRQSLSAIRIGNAGNDMPGVDGFIDDVQLYRRALSSTEVAQLYVESSRSQAIAPQPRSAETKRKLVLNPYEQVNWSDATPHHRVSLQSHTEQGIGPLSPADLIDAYKQQGYAALALTDVGTLTWPWQEYGRDAAEIGMLPLPGSTITTSTNITSLFSTFTGEGIDTGSALAGIDADGGIAVFQQPSAQLSNAHLGIQPAGRISLQPELRKLPEGEFAIETFFRSTSQCRHILVGNYSDDHHGTINIELQPGNRVRVFMQCSQTGKVVEFSRSADSLNIDTRDGEWHHLVVTRREGRIWMHLNGHWLDSTEDTLGSFTLEGDWIYLGRDCITPATLPKKGLGTIRLWNRSLCGAEIAALAKGGEPLDLPASDMRIEFSTITDLHDGFYSQSYRALNEFIEESERSNAEFIIQLGDFCRPTEAHRPVMNLWESYTGPAYHVLGNHDFTPPRNFNVTADFWAMPARYYTFDQGRIRGIVMDSNDIDAKQQEWLAEELANADRPVVIFLHIPIADTPAASAVHAILENAQRERPGGIIAAFFGHVHQDHAFEMYDIGFFLINSVGYVYLVAGGEFAKYGNRVEYADPLWARVAIDFNTGELLIYGRESTWASSDPWERGAPTEGFYNPAYNRPGISDRRHQLSPDTITLAQSVPGLEPDARGPLAEYRLTGISCAGDQLIPDSAGNYDGEWMAANPHPELIHSYAHYLKENSVLKSIEVLSRNQSDSDMSSDLALWDALLGKLMPRRPVWGTATDGTEALGESWIVIPATTLNEDAVRDALADGVYFMSSTIGASADILPPRVDSITHDPDVGSIHVQASDAGQSLENSAYTWIVHGQAVATGPTLYYRTEGTLPAGTAYVRLEIRGQGGLTLLNPFGFH